MIAADAPTLGAYYRRPGVAERIAARRAEARWRFRCGLAEATARARAAHRLAQSYDSMLKGRRLDRVAIDLHDIAAELEHLPADLAEVA